jgi:hypothetical protein
MGQRREKVIMELINSDKVKMGEGVIGGDDVNKSKEECRIKCFIISGGTNIISEYYEKVISVESSPSGEERETELYWVVPMFADFVRLPTGQMGIGMSPVNVFSKDEVIGPINPFSIICSYELDPKFIPTYKEKVLEVKAARAGLFRATKVPKIGDKGSKIIRP